MEGIMNPAEAKRILDRTECIFTWKSRGIIFSTGIKKFKRYVKDGEGRPSYLPKWCARVCLAYELYVDGSFPKAFEEIDRAVEDLANSPDDLSQKYRASCEHIVYATKAWMMYQCVREYVSVVSKIPLEENMSDLQKAGLNGFKANILREIVGKNLDQLIPFLKKAMKLDPTEYEWKISLVADMTRGRRYIREEFEKVGAIFSIPECLVREAIQIADCLLNDGSLTTDEKTVAKYYKAETLKEFILHKPRSKQIDDKSQQIDGLWRQILESAPDNTTYIDFGAKWFFLKPHRPNVDLILTVIRNALEQMPKNKHVNSAGKLVKDHLMKCPPNCPLRSSETAQRIVELMKDVRGSKNR